MISGFSSSHASLAHVQIVVSSAFLIHSPAVNEWSSEEEQRTDLSIIPGGMTSMLQPLDVKRKQTDEDSTSTEMESMDILRRPFVYGW
jgi:hypothetical protein